MKFNCHLATATIEYIIKLCISNWGEALADDIAVINGVELAKILKYFNNFHGEFWMWTPKDYIVFKWI